MLKNRGFKKLFWLIFLLVLVLAAFGAWLYTGQLTSAKQGVFQKLSLPIALVNGQAVTMKNFSFRYALAKKLISPQDLAKKDKETKQKILDELLNEKEAEIFAVSKNLSLSQSKLDQEYQGQAETSNLEGKKNFSELLGSYGLSEDSFKNQVLRPELLLTKIKIWFNSQTTLNQSAYQLANQMLARITSGEDMGKLARNFSQDQTGRDAKGDLGFVDVADLMEELKEPVAALGLGEVKIIPSRLGLHLLRAEAKNGNKVQLRQIFIHTGDFDAWWNAQKKNFKIYQLINF